MFIDPRQQSIIGHQVIKAFRKWEVNQFGSSVYLAYEYQYSTLRIQ